MTGCWNSREINTLAITICIGIDKTENGFKVTQQVLNPIAIASKKAVNQPAVELYVEEGKDIFSINRKMTTQCPRKIYYSHLRMVVLSEDVAKEGLESILDFFSRDHEYRTDFYFVIAKGTSAYNVLNTLTALESVPGIEMYNSLTTSENAWAPTHSVKIIELVNSIIEDGNNPVLTGVEITDKNNPSNSVEALEQSNVASKMNFSSICAFKKDKFAGWLSEDESKGYNYIMGNVKSTVGYIEYEEQGKITFEVKSTKSKIQAYLLNGKPAINVVINMETNIGAVTGDMDVTKEENLKKLIKISEERIASFCNDVLKKTKDDLKTDIFGFGEEIHRSYPKIWEKIKGDWNNEYANLPVNVTVHMKIMQLGQLTKSFFTKGKD
jgi:germination protein, Ger(x)C family